MAVPPFGWFEFRCPIAAFRKQDIYSLKAAMDNALVVEQIVQRS